MRRVFIFLMTVSVLGQAWVRSAWTLDYYLNPTAYLVACENKYRPELDCEGQCCLKKEIAASENADPDKPSLPEGFRVLKDIQLFFESSELLPWMFCEGQAYNCPFFTESAISDALIQGVFKPPPA
jgi:hypothetical protein